MTDEGTPTSGGGGAADPERVPADLAEQLRACSGDSVLAIVLYGSHLLRTSPDPHSAVDFVVVVDDYRSFYSAMAAAGALHRPVGLMSALARVLPPNVLAFAPDDGRSGLAKYLLVSRGDFERALGPGAPDHFLIARLIQRVGVLWTKDARVDAWLRACLDGARGAVLRWMAPYLDGPVDADALGRRILEVCYDAELRPESTARAERIYEAQAEHFRTFLGPVLEQAVAEGRMHRSADGYVLARPVPAAERRRTRRYFRRSKLRATARWLKHTVTFAGWLPYVVRKVERHTGRTIELTRLERALPIVFLWPRVVHVLLTRPRREIRS